MSSANWRLLISHQFIDIVSFSRYRLNSTGDKRHPWRTPTDVRNDCPISPSCKTAHVDGPCSDSSNVTSPSLMLYRRITRQSPLCHTLSNACLRRRNCDIGLDGDQSVSRLTVLCSRFIRLCFFSAGSLLVLLIKVFLLGFESVEYDY